MSDFGMKVRNWFKDIAYKCAVTFYQIKNSKAMQIAMKVLKIVGISASLLFTFNLGSIYTALGHLMPDGGATVTNAFLWMFVIASQTIDSIKNHAAFEMTDLLMTVPTVIVGIIIGAIAIKLIATLVYKFVKSHNAANNSDTSEENEVDIVDPFELA